MRETAPGFNGRFRLNAYNCKHFILASLKKKVWQVIYVMTLLCESTRTARFHNGVLYCSHLPGTRRTAALPYFWIKHRPSVGQLCSDGFAAPTRCDSETTGRREREIRDSWPCPEPWQPYCDRNTKGSGAASTTSQVDRAEWRDGTAVVGSVTGTFTGPQLAWQFEGNLFTDQYSWDSYYTPEINSFSMVFSAPAVSTALSWLKTYMRYKY